MRVMVVDGGGRGQALGKKLAGECDQVFVSPGNPGNEAFADSTGIAPTAVEEQLKFAERNSIDLTVVGADDPLAMGIVDIFQESKLSIFGPTKAQSRIEWDRDFAKKLAKQYGVPIGAYESFIDKTAALAYAEEHNNWPLYVKDKGLRQGKGVTRCEDIHEVANAIAHLDNFHIEDNVEGEELSLHSFGDGKIAWSIPILARDHKQLGPNDSDPMTGGMGTVAPLPHYNPAEVARLNETFAAPVVQELGFSGMLFSGLKGPKGYENSLEWNARFGDPEAQVFLRLMKSELLPLLQACVEGELGNIESPAWHAGQFAVCLVLAAEGYPTAPRKGAAIEGIEQATRIEGVDILQAGTKREKEQLQAHGGRVLNVVSMAETLQLALERAYQAAEQISFGGDKPVMRSDIGHSVLSGQ